MRRFTYVVGSVLLLVSACFSSSEKEQWVARYKNEYLTLPQIKRVLPKYKTKEDSLALYEAYIQKWLKEKAVDDQIEAQLSPEQQQEVAQRVADYRKDLLESYYNQQWLKENPIAPIKAKDIETYYTENKQSFIADQPYVLYNVLRVPKDSAFYYRRWIRSSSNEKKEKLLAKAKQMKYPHELGENTWVSFSKLAQILTIPGSAQPTRLLRQRQFFMLPEGRDVVLLQFKKYCLKGQQEPYEIAKDKIKSRLINKRKLNLLSQRKNELYKKAVQNGDIQKK